jgi:hypothetical protein
MMGFEVVYTLKLIQRTRHEIVLNALLSPV